MLLDSWRDHLRELKLVDRKPRCLLRRSESVPDRTELEASFKSTEKIWLIANVVWVE
jgi:hypothetical protein